MSLKVNINNRPAIIEAIKVAEGRATARTISPEDLSAMINDAEKKLRALKIPKYLWKGCKVTRHPPRVANSYQYRAEGTTATLTRGSKDWYLTSIHRTTTGSESHGGHARDILTLTPAAHASIPTQWSV